MQTPPSQTLSHLPLNSQGSARSLAHGRGSANGHWITKRFGTTQRPMRRVWPQGSQREPRWWNHICDEHLVPGGRLQGEPACGGWRCNCLLCVPVHGGVSISTPSESPTQFAIHYWRPSHALKQTSNFTHLMNSILEICGL